MLKIAICDDDIPLCTQLEETVRNHCMTKEIDFEVKPFFKGEDLLKSLKEGNSFDLIFLDIEMKAMTGVEVGSKIRGELDDYITKIVFVTSKQGYEQALFDVQPLNFIKKPLDTEKVTRCIELTLKLTQRESLFFEYKIGKEIHKEKLAHILYFEAQRKKVQMVTTTRKVIFYGIISQIKDQLPSYFIETHRSYLVNIPLSARITSDALYMFNGDRIPISQRNISQVRNYLVTSAKETPMD